MVNSRFIMSLLACVSLFVGTLQAFDKSKISQRGSSLNTWYEGPDVGWSWYKEAPLRPKSDEKDRDQKLQSKSGTQNSYAHTKQMDTLRKDFEELQAKAILDPTLENVREFQQAYNNIINRSTNFEKAWMMTSVLSPEGYRESDQSSPVHRKIYQEKMDKQLEEDIFVLSKTFGIFFIFKNDCPYCHEMAPTVRNLRDRYHFAIKAISSNGQTIEGFPEAVKDNGTIGQINPEGIFPALFLVNPHSGQTIPLARGLTTPSELKENFKVIIQFLKEQTNARL
jgi:conjugal transfer pilus assembly protein TraF